MFCEFSILAGDVHDPWPQAYGSTVGITQAAWGKAPVFAHPIDVRYIGPQGADARNGWPKIISRVYRKDAFGLNHLTGYSITPIPTEPGMYDLTSNVWLPALSYGEQVKAFFLGGSPALTDESVIEFGTRRAGYGSLDALETSSSGTLTFSLSVVFRNLH